MDTNYEKQKALEIKQLLETNASIKSDIDKLLNYLPYCEYELILYMIEKKVWTGKPPSPPEGFKPGAGTIELGLFLYWFNHPGKLKLSKFSFKEQLLILGIIVGLDTVLPSTKMNSINYDFFTNNELIYTDGTVLSTAKYATYDQGWFVAFLNLIESTTRLLWYNNGKFPTSAPASVPLKSQKKSADDTAGNETVTIGIFGDWGAGNSASKKVMAELTGLEPDYLVHVGDVYYAGTPLESSPNGSHYFSPGEEYQNLLDLWPATYKGLSFTLNSNHEMYSGANGLFYDALDVNKGPFNAQKGTSCFALEFGGWTILGLDTAFMGKVTDAFMTGSLGEPSGFQSQWIQGLGLDPKKTIVLSHHNGFADDCSTVSPLWKEVESALKGDPFAWYWGHVHNGIVYADQVTIPETNGTFTTTTFARCLGHAALPYGLASSLTNNKNIAWNANSPMPTPSKQLYNGFAVITLTTDNNGQLNGITEKFYDVSACKQPVWEKRLV